MKFRDKAPPSTKQMKVKVYVGFKSIIHFIEKIYGLANFPRFTRCLRDFICTFACFKKELVVVSLVLPMSDDCLTKFTSALCFVHVHETCRV